MRAGIPKPLEALTLKALSTEPRQRFRSAFDFRRSLAALDLGPDDAEPFVSSTATPPGGTPAPRPRSEPAHLGSARRLRRCWPASVAAVVTGVMGRGDRPGRPAPAATPGTPITIASIRSFDPEANPPTENEDRVRLAFDGKPGTAWSTERYHGAHFGGLKKGVGLIVRLDDDQRLSRLTVESSSRGWSAAVYVAATAKDRLADWGKPVVEHSAISGRGIFNLQSSKGGAVLLVDHRPRPSQPAGDQRARATQLTSLADTRAARRAPLMSHHGPSTAPTTTPIHPPFGT